MKYAMLMYASETETPQYSPEDYQASAREWSAFETEVKAAGVYDSFNGLTAVSDATSLRVRDGKSLITDGPFAETHEQLGGYYIFNCKDLDDALAWAAKIPWAKYGTIEVRPLNQWSQK
ncbi:MAG: YciI family protein [Chloroflexota bacterium]